MTNLIGSRNPRIEIRTSLDGIVMSPAEIEAQEKISRQKSPSMPIQNPISSQQNRNVPQNQQENYSIVDFDLNKANPKHYVVLPARDFGGYSYPETAVCIYRLGKNNQVGEVGKALDISVENTAKELTNDTPYIGKINWEQGMKLVLGLNGTPLTPRQGLDFLALAMSNQAKDLEGNPVDSKECIRLVREVLGKENPWRAEWLDADSKYLDSNGKPTGSKGTFYLDHSHKLQNGILVPKRDIMLPHLEESKWLNWTSLVNTSNYQGMATKDTQEGKDICFYRPSKDNNSVARFYANSGRASLDCYRNPSGSDSSLGVFACAEGAVAKKSGGKI